MTARSHARPRHVLFLCTGNSARSIGAEAMLNGVGEGRFVGHSAGSHPSGRVHPLALRVLAERGFETAGLRSKSWREFEGTGAPLLDFVVTVCDAAAQEACPVWTGRPVCVHWGLPDPAACEGAEPERLARFRDVYAELERRLRRLVELPVETLDAARLRAALVRIGTGREAA